MQNDFFRPNFVWITKLSLLRQNSFAKPTEYFDVSRLLSCFYKQNIVLPTGPLLVQPNNFVRYFVISKKLFSCLFFNILKKIVFIQQVIYQANKIFLLSQQNNFVWSVKTVL